MRKGTFVESCGRFEDPCIRTGHGKAHIFSVVLPKSCCFLAIMKNGKFVVKQKNNSRCLTFLELSQGS